MHSILRIHRLSTNARIPTRGSELAAGLDLYSSEDTSIPSFGQKLIKTDLQIELPEGCYGRIAGRSGLALNHRIHIGAGVIDRDYQGELKILLLNFADTDFHFELEIE